MGPPAFLPGGNRNGGHGVLRVVDDAGGDGRGVWHGPSLGPCAVLCADRLTGRFCAALPPGRAAVTRVDGLWHTYARTCPQLHFLAEYQLPRDNRPAAHPDPWRIHFRRRGHTQSLDADRPGGSAIVPGLPC